MKFKIPNIHAIASGFFRQVLKKMYHFDKWHIFRYRDKRYAIDIVEYCNSISLRSSVLEIGCGLGDIIRRLHFSKKYGFDLCPKVLNAARLLSMITFSNTQYTTFNFLENTLNGNFNVIICVNWIHEIEPEQLKKRLELYFNNNLLPNGRIIIDIIKNKSYKFNHDIKNLTKDIVCNVEKIGAYEHGREIIAIIKKG